MKLLQLIIILVFSYSINNAQVFKINEKWTLLGTIEDINNLEVFDSTCVDTLFKYNKDKIWYSYPRDKIFTSIKKAEGFWTYAKKSCIIDTKMNSATYKLTFNATWSKNTHPKNFPSGPHFSPLIGGVHNDKTSIWKKGEISSAGMESMAETGSVSSISRIMKNDNNINSTIKGSLLNPSPKMLSLTFKIYKNHPYLSIVSMLAPSPDWFVGINSLKLLDESNNWIMEKIIDLKLYDAGTDSGTRFTSSNSDTNPKEPIKELSDKENTDFENGKPFVGQFIITKQ